MPELTQIKLGSSLSAVKLWHMYVTKMWMGTLCKWKQKTNFRVILSENRVTGSVVDHKTTYTRRGHVSRWLRGSGCSHPPLTREAPSSIRIWSPTVSTVIPHSLMFAPYSNTMQAMHYWFELLCLHILVLQQTKGWTRWMHRAQFWIFFHTIILHLSPRGKMEKLKSPAETHCSYKSDEQQLAMRLSVCMRGHLGTTQDWGKEGGRGWVDYLNVPTTIAH